jgi:ERCC4-related helicase
VFRPRFAQADQADTSTTWLLVNTSHEQHAFMLAAVGAIQEISRLLNTWMGEEILVPVVDAIKIDGAERVGAVGRLCHTLRTLQDHAYLSDKDNWRTLSSQHVFPTLLNILGSIELCDLMGVGYALSALLKDRNYNEAEAIADVFRGVQSVVCRLVQSARLGARAGDADRLCKLRSELMQCSVESRVLVCVDTRQTARVLCEHLQACPEIAGRFYPRRVVGHGGWDGMMWHGEQETEIADFRRGSTRLLVATSVLEEGNHTQTHTDAHVYTYALYLSVCEKESGLWEKMYNSL